MTVARTERYVETCLNTQKPRPRRKVVLRDARLFLNTIDKTVDSIRRMGLDVKTDRRQRDGWVEYVVRVRVEP